MSAENMATVDLILNKKTESYGFEKKRLRGPV